MKKLVLLLAICATGILHAEECDEACKPPGLDPRVRDEILTGIALVAVGHAIGVLGQLSQSDSGTSKALSTIPMFGAIEGAATAGDHWQLRMTLVFSASLQIVGVLLATTAWAARNEHRVGVSGNGLGIQF